MRRRLVFICKYAVNARPSRGNLKQVFSFLSGGRVSSVSWEAFWFYSCRTCWQQKPQDLCRIDGSSCLWNPWMIYNEVFATLFHQLSWEIKNKEITFNVKIFYIWSSSSLFHVPLHYLESTLDLHCWTRGQIIHVVPLLFKVSSIIHSTATAAFLKALWTSPQP